MKETIAMIEKNLTEMGIPSFARATVVTQAISLLSKDLKLPTEPLSIGHFSEETQKLIDDSARVLIKATTAGLMVTLIKALTTVARNAIIDETLKEAKNAVLM